MNDERLRVVAAAVRDHAGVVYSFPPPARHNTVLQFMWRQGHEGSFNDGQGFLLSDGRFANRKRALYVATRAGQLICPPTAQGYGLFSQDVW